MIGTPVVGKLPGVVVSGSAAFGPKINTPDGKPLKLTVVDATGNTLAAGDQVIWEIWNVAVAAYQEFLMGKGHLTVYSSNP